MTKRKGGRPIKNFGRSRRSVERQLQGEDCSHPKKSRATRTNRNGKQFEECDFCNAFIRWL